VDECKPLVAGIRWCASPDGGHERPLLRALLLELAALQVPDAVAEVAAVGSGRYCSPRHGMPYRMPYRMPHHIIGCHNTIDQGS
jgi:hypothetical protein